MAASVVFFGSGSPYSVAALDALLQERPIAALVVPAVSKRNVVVRLLAWWLGRGLRRRARRGGVPVIEFQSALIPKADVYCVASFPFLLKPDLLRGARLAAINAHPSLLPRHRGADPIFWTYFADDRESGVTVHWLTQGVDDGDVVAQERMEVKRGIARRELEVAMGALAGRLLARSIGELELGTAARVPQDERDAVLEPLPSRAGWSIDYETWPAERVWHFLRGTGAAALRLGAPRTYVTGPHARTPGTLEGTRLYCRDGWVDLTKPPLRRRVLQMLQPRAK